MMLRIMSRPGRVGCKYLVLLYLCALSSAKEASNETETTTAKAEAGSSGAETSRVETIHLHEQETQPISKSYSYSGNVAGYLDQEPIYSHQQNEDQNYEYGKRVGGGQYKGSSIDGYDHSPAGYHHPKEVAHQSEYVDSFENYGQRQITDHDQSGGKGSSYSQVGKKVPYGQEDYGKDASAYAQGYSNEGNKQAVYVQGYSDGNDKQVAYAYDEPKTQQEEYIQDDVYGLKNFGTHANYGVEDAKISKGKGYEDISSYDQGSKTYEFPSKQTSKKTDYSSGSGGYSGKSSTGESAYGFGDYFGGKSSSGDIAYGSGGNSGGKSSSGDIAYGSGGYSGGKSSSGDSTYGSGGYSGGKSSSGDSAYGSGGYSGGKSSSGDSAYGSGGYSGGKSSSGGIAYGSPGYSEGKLSGNVAYSSGGKSSDGEIAYVSGAYSSGAYSPSGKSLSGGISYSPGVGDYSSGAKSLSGGSGYATGVADYASSGKSSHFPVFPKESGYLSGGSKETSYSKGGSGHSDASYYQGTPSKGSDLSSVLHHGQSNGGSDHGKVSVFIKQLGHSQVGDNYGAKNGERHGYLLLPVVPGKEGDKIKIATTGSYSGGGYKSSAQNDYHRRPVHATDGKSSYTSFFKTGVSSYGGDAKSSYSNGEDYGLGGASYGGDSKSAYSSGGDYSLEGHGGQKLTPTGHSTYAVGGHPSYESHSGSSKGTSYAPEYSTHGGQAYAQKGSPIYEVHSNDHAEGGHGILSENVKYVPSHEYQKQQYVSHDVSSYGKSAPQHQNNGKGTPYVKESSGYQLQGAHGASSKGYDHGQIEQTSYGHGGGAVVIPDNVKYISQSHEYEKQQPYGGHSIASYGQVTSQKQLNVKGTDFQPTNYKFSSPVINAHAGVVDFSSYNGNHNQKSSLSNHGESYGHPSSSYGASKGTSTHKKPKSIALILQRHQGGQQQYTSEGYKPPTFPVQSEAAAVGKSSSQGYSSGFQPIIPKYAGGGSGRSTSLHYHLQNYQASPSYSAIDHTKGGSRYY